MIPSSQESPPPLLALHERSRYRAAADYALRRYPGPVGELIHRELSAYAEFGHRFAQDALIPHLAQEVLTPRAAADEPGRDDPAEHLDASTTSGRVRGSEEDRPSTGAAGPAHRRDGHPGNGRAA